MKKREPDSAQWCPVTRQEVMGTNWTHMKLYLNTRKHFFMVKVVKHWNRFPREVMKCPSLDISKADWMQSWAICHSWPCLNKELDKTVSRGTVPASKTLWFYDSHLKMSEIPLFCTLPRNNNGCSHNAALLITEFLPLIGYKGLTPRELYFLRLPYCKQLSIFVLYERLHSFNLEFTLRSSLQTS